MLELLPFLSRDCFSTDYRSARQKLISAKESLLSGFPGKHQCFTHPLTGPNEETLCTDVIYLGPEKPDKLLVLISATHGVEGFAGSAIQLDCLSYYADELSGVGGLGIYCIHALNPWGFAWLRRGDHHNIDINRNFIDFNRKPQMDDAYQQALESIFGAGRSFQGALSDLWQESGLSVFADKITRGQFENPQGIFYGGTEASWSRNILEQITSEKVFVAANNIAVIDLHTGLGPYGYGELINDHKPGSEGFRLAETFYGRNACSALLGESCSAEKDGLIDYHWHRVMQERGCFVTLEFGTYSLENLLSTLIEEQHYQNSLEGRHALRSLAHPSVSALRDFFYPEEESWQAQILFRGRQAVSMAIKGMMR